MAKKHYPVVRQFPLAEASPSGGQAIRAIDVGRCLSQANRRLYRYGRVYKSKIDLEPDSNTVFEVYTLRDDWAVHQGFKLAYEAHRKNSEDEAAMMADSQKARWADFRARVGIAGDQPVGPQFNNGSIGGVANLLNQGEFAETFVVDGAGAARTFTWAPVASSSEYSILAEYDKVGNAQTTPSSTVSGMAYDDLDSTIDASMMNQLETQNDNPPYDRDSVNATHPWVKIATLDSSNPNAMKLSTGFFNAPCGLILVVQAAYSDIAGKYSLTVQAGDYKGVSAPSMLE
jgi:hypothetical protein